jgi:plastocyanin
MHSRFRLLALALCALLGMSSAPVVLAQEATPDDPAAVDGTPVAVTSQGISLVAGGLANPRGITWDSDGEMYVALAGSGGTTMTQDDSPASQQYGPIFAGNTASVVRIAEVYDVTVNGCPIPVAGGLPSTRGMSGHDQGPGDVAFLEDTLYVLQDAAGAAATYFPDKPNGVYAVEPDGSVRLVLDLKTWHEQNPVANVPEDLTEESEPFAMLAGPGFLWVLEANSGQVLKVTPDGDVTRVADLSEGHPVPTGLALAPEGGVYVGFLTHAPYEDGSSRVVHVADDGTVTEVWTGLTMVTGLAVGPDGVLYALEMATGNTDDPPFISPGTGRIVRQTGPDTLAEVVVGLDFPISMTSGPDGALYVSYPAFGADDTFGGIVRVDLSAPQPMQISPGLLNLSQCDVQAPMPGSDDGDDMGGDSMGTPTAATPVAGGEASPVPAETDGKTATGAQTVNIQNFAFNPDTLSVPVGTTVTWNNLDNTAHTATADDGSFQSGTLQPGQSFSFQFQDAGTFTYNCAFHPNMQGTIEVTS